MRSVQTRELFHSQIKTPHNGRGEAAAFQILQEVLRTHAPQGIQEIAPDKPKWKCYLLQINFVTANCILAMRLSNRKKEDAIQLRKQGYSIKEIAKHLEISQSTSSVWLRTTQLNTDAQKRLKNKEIINRNNTSARWNEKRKILRKLELEKANTELQNIEILKPHAKISCALLYWCEGEKTNWERIRFTNSDPQLMQLFLKLFRLGFPVDERKFRIIMHLHEYHDEEQQKNIWSDLTNIPLSQFNKTYKKSNSGKRTKDGYLGCISVSYHDASMARELQAIYRSVLQKMGV